MRDLSWKTLSSKYIYKDRWFIARADSCALPNGKIIEPYYVLEFPNWCNVVVVTNDDKILMVRQYRHAINKTTIELPGGVIDKDENPKDAAIREVLEETGYTISQINLLYTTAPNPATNNNLAYFYLAKANKNLNYQNTDPFEDIDILLVDKNEVLEMIHNSQIIHGVQIGAIYAAYQKLGWIEQKI